METHTWLTTVELVYLVVVLMGLIQLAGVLSRRFRFFKCKRRKNWSSAAKIFTSYSDHVASTPWHCQVHWLGEVKTVPSDFFVALHLTRLPPLMREIFLFISGYISSCVALRLILRWSSSHNSKKKVPETSPPRDTTTPRHMLMTRSIQSCTFDSLVWPVCGHSRVFFSLLLVLQGLSQ
jgi:hypothetical protein